ncbi:MAG TPA: hypothetical protein VEC12_05245 [Bacteroidia bacterium]|nr:hypothetical protein [Bacteroidia bacterium]
MLELLSGPRLHAKPLLASGQNKESSFLFQKSDLFCQLILTDETTSQVSSPVFSQAKSHVKYLSFGELQQTVKNSVAVGYSSQHPVLSPSYTNTVIIFPFHYFL